MAKAFQFPLEKVLNYRSIIEDNQAIKLKKSQMKLKIEQDNLVKLEQTKSSAFLGSNRFSEQGLFITDLKITRDYVSQISDNISEQHGEIKKNVDIVEKNRQEVLKATQEKTILEKLKERHFDDFKRDNRKSEIKTESEVAIRISQNKNISGSK